ncbi:hypothetical protein TREES_T100011646 [Tupaia chinensis]|uniref:Uncharacterized protein n=1 Tax=Tupaia chinensis TaxID=246437 RepID=L9L2A4_TUPCH|nr:hypothetical protein TREES_T100011646 [Tupaia chinensis]
MKGLLSAVRWHLWLLLGQLWAPLHLTTESLRQALGIPALPCVALACGTVVVLMVKRRHILWRVKELSDRCSAHQEVPREGRRSTGPVIPAKEALRSSSVEAEPPKFLCLLILQNYLVHFTSGVAHFREEVGKWEPPDPSLEVPGERRWSTGPVTPAEEALRSSPLEAELPKLQFLCLVTLRNNLPHFMSGSAHFWEEAGKWEPLDTSQVTDPGSILEWPKKRENLLKKGKECLNNNAHVREEEIERWKPSAREREEEGERSDLSKAPT